MLISKGSVRISEHGYEELSADGLLARELVEGVEAAEVIETIRTTLKDHAYYYANGLRMGAWSTLCGDFQPVTQVRQC